MGKSGRFWEDMTQAFGEENVTSGYRTQEEQDALVRAGKTRATKSSHTYEDGYDVSPRFSDEEVRKRLAARGLGVNKIVNESGRGRNQGTGPHKHVEVFSLADGPTSRNGERSNSSRPGRGVANPQVLLDSLASSLAPESKASGNVSTNATTIYNSDGEFNTRANKVEDSLQQQSAGLDVLRQVQDAAQATQVLEMSQQIEDTRAISGEIVDGTEKLKAKVLPVFQARGRIADQLDKVNTMNPLERGIRGIFDLNYDRKHLEGQLEHYDKTLQTRANDFDYLNKLHTVALTEIDRRYGLNTALPELAVKQTNEDLGLLGMRLQQSAAGLSSLRERVSGETQLIAAKAAARDDMISRLDSPTVLDLANQAKQGGGLVHYNGAEFSYHELRERLERDESQSLSVRSQRMAIANGEVNLAEQHAINLARSLTREQAEAAIANGGVYSGIQLPQDVLTSVYQGHVSRATTQAETVSNTLPTAAALGVASAEMTRITTLHSRTTGMFGPTGIPGATQFMQEGTRLTRALIAATEQSAAPEVITALTQKIAANSTAMEAALDRGLVQRAGGDKASAGYMKSFVMGVPLDSSAATSAITHFAMKGALPEGIAMSPEARQLFSIAGKAVTDARTANPKIGLEALRQKVSEAVMARGGQVVGQARFDRLNNDLPLVARQTNHPFGRMDGGAWRQANANAAAAADSAVASGLDTTPQNIRQMRTSGKPIDTTPEFKALFDKFRDQAANYNAVEQGALVRELDELPQATPGRRNSSVLLDFLQSPAMHTAASRYSDNTGAASMGDYFVNPISAGATETMFGQHAQGMVQSQAATSESNRRNARIMASAYGHSPVTRARTILGGIEGIGPDGAKALMPFIQETLAKPGIAQPGASIYRAIDHIPGLNTSGDNDALMSMQDAAVKSALASTKFEDPRLENYRKVAVRGWDNIATQQKSFFQSLVSSLNPLD